MMYVLMVLASQFDKEEGWAADKPIKVASSSSKLLYWFRENYPNATRFCQGQSCAKDVVWSCLAKVDGQTKEFACFEVEKIQ